MSNNRLISLIGYPKGFVLLKYYLEPLGHGNTRELLKYYTWYEGRRTAHTNTCVSLLQDTTYK